MTNGKAKTQWARTISLYISLSLSFAGEILILCSFNELNLDVCFNWLDNGMGSQLCVKANAWMHGHHMEQSAARIEMAENWGKQATPIHIHAIAAIIHVSFIAKNQRSITFAPFSYC